MPDIRSALLKQALFLPFFALLQVALGLFAEEYHSLSQHISELGLRENALGIAIRTLAFLLGLSLLLLCAGLFLAAKKKTQLSLLMLLLFAMAMISNGIFKMGSPLHGLFGAGMIIVLVPLALTLDFVKQLRVEWITTAAAITSLLSFVYLWAGVVGLEPEAFAGITQRIIMLINLFWFAAFAVNVKFAE